MNTAQLCVGYILRRYPVLSETFVRLEVEELRRRGVEVVVVAAGAEEDVRDDVLYVRGAQQRSRAVYAAAHLRWLARHPRRWWAARQLVRAAGDESFDCEWPRLAWVATELRRRGVQVLHAHFAWSAASHAWALSRLLDVPWVLTVHARDMYVAPVRLREKLAAADAVVTVCRYNEEQLRTTYGITVPVSQVICGVEVPESVDRTGASTTEVMAVGRLVPKKGFDLLVSADLPAGATVTVYGDGPEADALRAAAGPAVRFAGATPHEEVLEAMSRAAVLCLPARIAPDGDRDSMPLVVKEAMARAVPVVVTDVAGLGEMVDSEVGWIVAPDDPAALSKALSEALGDSEEAARRGRRGRARVQERFRLEDQVARLAVLLEDVAAR